MLSTLTTCPESLSVSTIAGALLNEICKATSSLDNLPE
jgi:hypothetical protein